MINKKLKVGNVPNLRFPEFTKEWQSSRLADTCEINPKNEGLPSSFVYIDLESVENGRLLKEDFISKDGAPSRAQRVLSKNDVLFQMVRPYQKNNLFFDKEGKYVASTGYAQIRTKQNSRFIFQYLHNQKFVDNVIERCTGTSYPAINSTDLGNIKIGYPSLEEQTKIASFLSLIDERIQTQNKIIEQLETLIKGLSEKIYSQKIRFKKFTEKWEVKKLGEIATFYSGGTPLTSKREYFNGNIPFIRSGEINCGKTEQFISELGLKNSSAKIVEVGDILYALYGATSGEIGLSKIRGAINQAVLCIKSDQNHYFIYSYLSYKKESIVSRYLQGGQGNLSAEIVKQIKIYIPALEEQINIAGLLSSIDQKLQTEKNILDKYQSKKQFLLQNLFI
ncbi:restriction endonuclease subunit S [Empedobacter brevis]